MNKIFKMALNLSMNPKSVVGKSFDSKTLYVETAGKRGAVTQTMTDNFVPTSIKPGDNTQCELIYGSTLMGTQTELFLDYYVANPSAVCWTIPDPFFFLDYLELFINDVSIAKLNGEQLTFKVQHNIMERLGRGVDLTNGIHSALRPLWEWRNNITFRGQDDVDTVQQAIGKSCPDPIAFKGGFIRLPLSMVWPQLATLPVGSRSFPLHKIKIGVGMRASTGLTDNLFITQSANDFGANGSWSNVSGLPNFTYVGMQLTRKINVFSDPSLWPVTTNYFRMPWFETKTIKQVDFTAPGNSYSFLVSDILRSDRTLVALFVSWRDTTSKPFWTDMPGYGSHPFYLGYTIANTATSDPPRTFQMVGAARDTAEFMDEYLRNTRDYWGFMPHADFVYADLAWNSIYVLMRHRMVINLAGVRNELGIKCYSGIRNNAEGIKITLFPTTTVNCPTLAVPPVATGGTFFGPNTELHLTAVYDRVWDFSGSTPQKYMV